MSRVLIMVLSCGSHPFDLLMAAQMKTWGSIECSGVETVFYRGSNALKREGLLLEVPCDDGYNAMHWKTKLAFDQIWDSEWDFIFRTNASSYVNKKQLLLTTDKLPRSKCYKGTTGQTKHSKIAHVGGDNIFLSRDCVDILRRGLTANNVSDLDDGEFANVLFQSGIRAVYLPGRVDRMYYEWNKPLKCSSLELGFSYKCKAAIHENDRAFNIRSLFAIHTCLTRS